MSVLATQKWVWQKTLLDAMLAALHSTDTVALTVTPTLVLIKDANPITAQDAIANHTLCDFTGYGAATISYGGPVNEGSIGTELVANALWVGGSTTGTFNDNNITGVLLTDGVATLYGGEKFADTVGIGETGDYLDYTLLLPLLFTVPAG